MDYFNDTIHIMNSDDLRRIDLNLLLIFDALMVEKNVTRAAERVYLSQPAMSNALKRLRETLDDPILLRGPGGMRPTPRALQLHEPVRDILNRIAATMTPPVPFEATTSTQQFVIAMNDYGETAIFPTLAERAATLAPRAGLATFSLTAQSPEPLLADGQIDAVIGVAHYTSPSSRLITEPLFNDDLVCLAGENQNRINNRITLKQYLRYRHVYPSPLGVKANIVDNWIAQKNKQRDIAITVRSYWAAAEIVANSSYLVTAPRRVANKLAMALPLNILELPHGAPRFELVLTHHELHSHMPHVRWLLELIRSTCHE